MKKVAVVLSGCGVFDGAEIYESVLTLLHLAKQGADYQCFAPDQLQMHTINHLTGEELEVNRNVLEESARIARGNIHSLDQLNVEEFGALILPGGFGAAKNFSDFAVNGKNAKPEAQLIKVCRAFKEANKPAGYICIAPSLIPFVYEEGVKLTIGKDQDTATALNALGAEHIDCEVNDICVDSSQKVVSTPAYMLAENILQADEGIEKLVKKVISMI